MLGFERAVLVADFVHLPVQLLHPLTLVLQGSFEVGRARSKRFQLADDRLVPSRLGELFLGRLHGRGEPPDFPCHGSRPVLHQPPP